MYEAKNYSRLLGTRGFSDVLLNNHFALYEGYVKNVNKVSETLKKMLEEGNTVSPEYAELKRRFGWEFSGMRLHEYYFGNMTKEKSELDLDNDSELARKIKSDFGSNDNWMKDFKAVGSMRGIGWAVLYHDPVADRLFNVWINEHEFGHLAGGAPIMALDVFEHAYTMDYGIKRADYIEAFFNAIDWNVAAERLKARPRAPLDKIV